jgi:hypothetical protein
MQLDVLNDLAKAKRRWTEKNQNLGKLPLLQQALGTRILQPIQDNDLIVQPHSMRRIV